MVPDSTTNDSCLVHHLHYHRHHHPHLLHHFIGCSSSAAKNAQTNIPDQRHHDNSNICIHNFITFFADMFRTKFQSEVRSIRLCIQTLHCVQNWNKSFLHVFYFQGFLDYNLQRVKTKVYFLSAELQDCTCAAITSGLVMAAVSVGGFGFPPQPKTSQDPENMLLVFALTSRLLLVWLGKRNPTYLRVLEVSRYGRCSAFRSVCTQVCVCVWIRMILITIS